MSQGDIEKRTDCCAATHGVENGHTFFVGHAGQDRRAMDLALSRFFSKATATGPSKGIPQLSTTSPLSSQMRRYSANLNDSDRKLVLAMVKKMAANAK